MTFLPTIPYHYQNFPPYIIYYIYNFAVCIYVYIDIWIYKYIDVLIDGYMGTTSAQARLLFVSVLWFCVVFVASLRPCSLLLLCLMRYLSLTFCACLALPMASIYLVLLACILCLSIHIYRWEYAILYIYICTPCLGFAKKCRFVLSDNARIKWKIYRYI